MFLLLYLIPFESVRISGAINEAFLMAQDYVRNHILLSLIPAFFISGAISVFFSKQAVVKYLGSRANKAVSYAIASVSGSVLSVCSCTIIPIFGSIYKRGAGLGPAMTFLYAGPAINVLAIILTARVLGWELGLARVAGALIFAVVIGLVMSLLFRREEEKRGAADEFDLNMQSDEKPPVQVILFFTVMLLILVSLSWTRDDSMALWNTVYSIKWYLSAGFFIVLILILLKWFVKRELADWMSETRRLVIDMVPLLFTGILLAGFFLGRPGHEGIIPAAWIELSVGSNSLLSNFIASMIGGLMYFCTLMEVPVLDGLMGSGMNKGPALALLLAGPSISLPHMLVVHKFLGLKKTAAYVTLVIILSTIAGMIYGNI